MRQILIILTLSSLIIYSCGILDKMGGNIANTMFEILPDTCEFYLIEEISYNRKNSFKIPIGQDLLYTIDSLDSLCKERFDSIYAYNFNSDSIDLRFRKTLIINGTPGYINKKYRIKFVNDSIIVLKMPEATIVKKTKNKNNRFQPNDTDMRIDWKEN